MRRPAGERRTPKPVRQQRSSEPFWMLQLSVLVSPAWQVLNLNARRVLDRIVIEHLNHGGQNNGNLPVTYQNFEDYGIERHSIMPALKELTALGFIKITRKGSYGNAEFKRPSLYEVTLFPIRSELSGQEAIPAVNSWRRLDTLEEAKKRQAEARASNSPATSKSRATSRLQSRPTSKPNVVRNQQRPR
jgi:hypothetical protein